jgi:DNA-binding PadR family transcriptional regulator
MDNIQLEQANKTIMKGFTNGITRGLILFTLYNEPMHGYEIIKRINESFSYSIDNKVLKNVKSSKIYPILINMEELGVIKSETEERNNKSVKTYYITSKGEEILFMRKNKSKEFISNPYLKDFFDFMFEDYLNDIKNSKKD